MSVIADVYLVSLALLALSFILFCHLCYLCWTARRILDSSDAAMLAGCLANLAMACLLVARHPHNWWTWVSPSAVLLSYALYWIEIRKLLKEKARGFSKEELAFLAENIVIEKVSGKIAIKLIKTDIERVDGWVGWIWGSVGYVDRGVGRAERVGRVTGYVDRAACVRRVDGHVSRAGSVGRVYGCVGRAASVGRVGAGENDS